MERIDSPCPDPPIATTIAVFTGTSETDVVAQIATGQDGRFSQRLDPGTYTLRGACVAGMSARSPHPRTIARSLTVVTGAYTAVTVRADTGIR